MNHLKTIFAFVKPHLRWLILAATFIFLGQALANHWQEVVDIEISSRGWAIVAAALLITLFSHIWSGLVWTWILREFDCTVPKLWTVRVYLKTNIAKYLPGNVWHFYGRVRAMHAAQVPWAIAVLSVVIEPLLDIAAALLLAVGLGGFHRPVFQLVGLAIVLLALHPAVLNPGTHFISKMKLKPAKSGKVDRVRAGVVVSGAEQVSSGATEAGPVEVAPSQLDAVIIKRYPAIPLLGELIFYILRSLGFLLIVLAMGPLELQQMPILMSSFSVAYFLGLVVPGAPGGIGVFEATLVALLELHFSAGLLLKAVAIYRLVSIIAEVTGAAIASVELPQRT